MEKAMPQRKRLYSSVLPPRGVTAHLCCAVVLYLTASLYSLAETPAADAAIPRLALLASGDEKAAAIVALVEAELSTRDDVLVLERAAIDALLQEQALTAVATLGRETSVKMGQLLACDLLAHLTVDSSTGNPLRLKEYVIMTKRRSKSLQIPIASHPPVSYHFADV